MIPGFRDALQYQVLACVMVFSGHRLAVSFLILIIAQFSSENTLSNGHNAILHASRCSAPLRVTLVTFFVKVSTIVITGGASLLVQVITRSRLKRELFFWTKKLDVRSITTIFLGPVHVYSWMCSRVSWRLVF